MNPEIKAKWLEALKSGKYPKTKGYLNRLRDWDFLNLPYKPAGYCCLGVLCDISGLGGWKDLGDYALYVIGDYDEAQNEYLPDAVATWAGMPAQKGSGIQEELADINDMEDTFEPVIEYIEKNL